MDDNDAQRVQVPLPGGSLLEVSAELGPPAEVVPAPDLRKRRPYLPQGVKIELRATGHWRAIVGALGRRMIRNMISEDIGGGLDYEAIGAETVTQRITWRKKPRGQTLERVVVTRASRRGAIRAILYVTGPLTQRQRDVCSGWVRVYLRKLVQRWRSDQKSALREAPPRPEPPAAHKGPRP